MKSSKCPTRDIQMRLLEQADHMAPESFIRKRIRVRMKCPTLVKLCAGEKDKAKREQETGKEERHPWPSRRERKMVQAPSSKDSRSNQDAKHQAFIACIGHIHILMHSCLQQRIRFRKTRFMKEHCICCGCLIFALLNHMMGLRF